jgi:hypothetical protein
MDKEVSIVIVGIIGILLIAITNPAGMVFTVKETADGRERS